ncbi:MAG: hypothetical protein ACM3RP_01970 [Chitinophagales bacterium]
MKSQTLRRLGQLLAAALISIALLVMVFQFAVRPWYLNWGATPAEISGVLPGDRLVPEAQTVTTRALTVNAPPEKIWPWLIQVGFKRAGWYNFDKLNQLLGAADYVDGHRSAWRIVPEFQRIKVGDYIRIHPVSGFYVAGLEPNRYLALWSGTDLATNKPLALGEALPARYMQNTLTVVPVPEGAQTTHLIVRERVQASEKLGGSWSVLEPGVALQETAFRRRLKVRAERGEGGGGK